MKKRFLLLLILLFTGTMIKSQNVFIVVIDGARYSETFGAEDKYIPNIWNNLKSNGSIYTNFFNDGKTKTLPGHSSIITGTWQDIANDGTEHPADPTIFEYFREQQHVSEDKIYVVAGANKLSAVSYSIDTLFGSRYQASVVTNDYTGDLLTYQNLINVLEVSKPQLVLVNFKQVDIKGHSGNWKDYLQAIRQVDSLIYELWKWLEKDDYYYENTTMLVTNDHGRHNDLNGGFQNHGCDCDGCRHIMLFAIGNNIPKNQIINEKRYQVDIAPTVADLLSINFPLGESLLGEKSNNVLSVRKDKLKNSYKLHQNFPNPFNPTTTIKYTITNNTEVNVKISVYDILGREVRSLINKYQKAGNYDLTFDAGNLSGGVYYYKFQSDSFVDIKKMLLLK